MTLRDGMGGGLLFVLLVAQSCPTLPDPMDCSPPGSYVHGILQARILEWVAISFSKGRGRKAQKGIYIYIMIDSHCYMLEINTTL